MEADMKRIIVLSLACLLLAAGATLLAKPGAAKPAANPVITVGFSGQAGDGVLGDGLGNYVGGVGGVVAEFQVNGNTPAWSGFANALVNITTTGGKKKRYFLLNYPELASGRTLARRTANSAGGERDRRSAPRSSRPTARPGTRGSFRPTSPGWDFPTATWQASNPAAARPTRKATWSRRRS
jgi:hypothetical protein